MKIAHEVPIALMKESRKWNDYQYGLLHLLTNEEYKNFFIEESKNGRETLLDNSLFELGDAMSNEALAEGIETINPTWFVVPDALNNANLTISRWESWEKDFGGKYKGAIGVVQGDTWEDQVECYKYMAAKADKVAIPMSLSTPYKKLYGNIHPLMKQWLGRTDFIRDLMRRGIWNFEKPHHLLGATQVIEFRDPLYTLKCFDSLDTSNPIVHGLEGQKYGTFGLTEKSPTKLADLIKAVPNETQLQTILYNVQQFKRIVNGV